MLKRGESAAPGPPRPRGVVVALACVLVGAVVLATHWPVLRAGALALDDDLYVTYNPLVSRPGWESAGRFFREVLEPSSVQGYYHPLAMTSLMLDHARGGRADDLRAFHRTSLALHVINSVLVFLILHGLFGGLLPAAAAALAFGLHPLTVEPVAWVAERKALLAGLFSFASVLLYVGYCRRSRPRAAPGSEADADRGAAEGIAARGWLAAAAGCYALALLSKPTATPLPALLLLLDAWPLCRLDRRALLEKWPFYLLAALAATVTLVSQQRVGGIAAAGHTDLARWPLQVGYVLSLYLRNLAWPAQLTVIYPRPEPLTLSNPAVLAGVLGVVALTVCVVALVRRTHAPLVAWLFLVVGLAPTLVLGLVKYSWVIAFDNYLYVPALGFFALLAAAIGHAWKRPGRLRFGPPALVVPAVLVVLALEAGATRATLRNWTDSLTLYRYMERIAPDSPVIHNRLGILLAAQSDHDAATRELEKALALEPAYGDAHYNLGIVLARQGRAAESIEHFQKAAEILPRSAEAAYNLGQALRLVNRPAEAERELRRALLLAPDYVDAMDQLGSMLAMQGRAEEAARQFRMALALAPEAPRLHYQLALTFMMMGGRTREAAQHLERAVRAVPDWAEALNALAWLRATSPDPAVRDTAEALRHARRAVELTGEARADILDTRAAAEAAAGRFDEAAATARRARDRALEAGADSLARSIDGRARLYQRRVAYIEPARTSTP